MQGRGPRKSQEQELEFQGADDMPAYVELLTSALREADAHLIRQCAPPLVIYMRECAFEMSLMGPMRGRREVRISNNVT